MQVVVLLCSSITGASGAVKFDINRRLWPPTEDEGHACNLASLAVTYISFHHEFLTFQYCIE
jgi:hypothetical protein